MPTLIFFFFLQKLIQTNMYIRIFQECDFIILTLSLMIFLIMLNLDTTGYSVARQNIENPFIMFQKL